jgi:hypothetical protein
MMAAVVTSLLTVLSLNTNKRADLGGLHAIITETEPRLVFSKKYLPSMLSLPWLLYLAVL